MKLWIIAGHGDGDPGAIGYNGLREADINRAIANTIKKLGGNNVIYLDPAKDHYKEKTLAAIAIPHGDTVLEIHLDAYSYVSDNARGGHVIIDGDKQSNNYDLRLAMLLQKYAPGRVQRLVHRQDLYNCNITQKRGIDYRLMECCFLTSPTDMENLRNNIEAFAAKILEAFNIPDTTKKTNKAIYADKWIELDHVNIHIDKYLLKEVPHTLTNTY